MTSWILVASAITWYRSCNPSTFDRLSSVTTTRGLRGCECEFVSASAAGDIRRLVFVSLIEMGLRLFIGNC